MAINDQSYDAIYDKLFKDKRKSKKLIYEKAQAMSVEIVLPYLSYFTLFYRKLFKESAAVIQWKPQKQSILRSGLEIMSIKTFEP